MSDDDHSAHDRHMDQAAMINNLGHLAGIMQRNRLMEQQKEQAAQQAAATREQTRVLEKQAAAAQAQRHALEEQNRIEQSRSKTEQGRLNIEAQRFAAENAEREQRRLQADQIKQLRILMADTMDSLAQLKKIRPAP